MATMTLAYRMTDQQELTIPQEALAQLGLREGDAFQVKIETIGSEFAQTDSQELRRKAEQIFVQADGIERESSKPLNDAFEGEWARGVEDKARRMGITL